MSIRDLKVLIIDDNLADAEIIRIIMEDIGIQDVHILTNAEDALSMLKKKKDNHPYFQPDLILLDMNMPRMNGKEFLKEAGKYIQGTYVMIMSGLAKDTFNNMLHRMIVKPCTSEEIDDTMNIIREVVDEIVVQKPIINLDR